MSEQALCCSFKGRGYRNDADLHPFVKTLSKKAKPDIRYHIVSNVATAAVVTILRKFGLAY
ncbi:hypothetical protein A7K91_04005 [Paenibacillus oryzae]|uniref:Uncharacterized protein n=1 Tax=Paenibacillus oryzae TaxID=1844972 RepID=A0A1A5YH75_9BACL|nr:hypothetical protein A7K91_04005 [Paenibacillus oryzae]